MNRPRWLHVMPTFNLGGAETRTARLMNAFGGRVHHTIVPTLPGETAAQKLLEPNLPVEFPHSPCRFKGPPLPVRLWEIGRFLRHGGFDLVPRTGVKDHDAVVNPLRPRILVARPSYKTVRLDDLISLRVFIEEKSVRPATL